MTDVAKIDLKAATVTFEQMLKNWLPCEELAKAILYDGPTFLDGPMGKKPFRHPCPRCGEKSWASRTSTSLVQHHCRKCRAKGQYRGSHLNVPLITLNV